MRHLLLACGLTLLATTLSPARDRWTPEKAQEWWKNRGWMSGANYLPNNAINQLEMWQAETFDPATIDRELGWARDLGFNSMRVFLHHLPHEQDPAGFLERVDKFLESEELSIELSRSPKSINPDPDPKNIFFFSTDSGSTAVSGEAGFRRPVTYFTT